MKETGISERQNVPEDIGLIKTEVVVDGLKRYWYTFEPSSYKRRLKDKFPLIIAIHGFSCSGEYFAENGWHRVGEERGAIVVYPTAYPFDRTPHEGRFGKNIAVTPAWNSGMFSIETDPRGPDELNFFKKLLEMVEEKLSDRYGEDLCYGPLKRCYDDAASHALLASEVCRLCSRRRNGEQERGRTLPR